jgi:hypothetical protein
VSGGWWAAIIGLALAGWSFYLDGWHDASGRLASWWVGRASEQGPWAAGPQAFLTSLGALLCFGAVTWAGSLLDSARGTHGWTLAMMLSALLAYAPFVFITMPTKLGYATWRGDLRDAGADPALQRSIAWGAGLPSLVGMCVTVAVLFETLLR